MRICEVKVLNVWIVKFIFYSLMLIRIKIKSIKNGIQYGVNIKIIVN